MEGRSVGPYQLVSLLGQGGMGAVWRARHRELGVDRALKLLPAHAEGKKLARFEREGRNLARVDHPNVVRVHEAALDGGRPYLVMDLVDGASLERVLRAPRLPIDRALELALGVARGVAALHAAGIVHRDLKPENVLVRQDGLPVVVDLGLAVAPELDERLTRTGGVVGTPMAMAPEQLQAEPVGPQADVWALGLILFHLLTGQSASPQAESMKDLVQKVTRADRPRLSSVDPDLPAALDELVARLLDRSPARRPADAGQVVAALEAIVAGRAAGHDGLPTARVARRRRAVALAAGLGLTLVAGGALLARRPAPAPRLDAAGPPPGTEAAPSDPPPEQGAAPRAPGPEEVQEAGRDLRRLARAPDRAQRRAALEEWLARWPEHPDRPEALALLRDARRGAPLRTVPAPRTFAARLLDDGRVLGTTSGGLHVWDTTGARAQVTQGGNGPLVLLEPRGAGAPLGRVAGAGAPPGRVAGAGAPPGRVAGAGAPLGRTPGVLVGDRRGVHLLDPDLRPVATTQLPADVLALAATPDGRLALAGDAQGHAHLLEPATGRVVMTLPKHGNPVWAVALTPDAAWAVTGSGAGTEDPGESDNSIRLWRPHEGALARREVVGGKVMALALRPGAGEVLVGTSAGRLYVFSLSRAGPVAELQGAGAGDTGRDLGGVWSTAHRAAIRDVACSPDGRRAWSVSGGLDRRENELRCWDLETRQELYVVAEHEHALRSVHVSPDGARLVTGGERGPLEVWSAE